MSKGGLGKWFGEEWTDIKTGKPCGRSSGEKRGYPACRPKTVASRSVRKRQLRRLALRKLSGQ